MKQKGFTLIELMLVVSIISLISSIFIVTVKNARSSSRDANRKLTAHQLETAMELYYSYNNMYPENVPIGGVNNTGVLCSGTPSNFANITSFNPVPLTPTYLVQLPVDPLNYPLQYEYACNNSGNDYGFLIPFGNDGNLPTCKIESSPNANVFNGYPLCGF